MTHISLCLRGSERGGGGDGKRQQNTYIFRSSPCLTEGTFNNSGAIFLEKTRKDHLQSDRHWNCFRGKTVENSGRRDGAHMDFSELVDSVIIWNLTELRNGVSGEGTLFLRPKCHTAAGHLAVGLLTVKVVHSDRFLGVLYETSTACSSRTVPQLYPN